MPDSGESRRDGPAAPLTLVVPLLPGQSEAWRRVVQELQASRRADFEAACRRWGLRHLALWLAPARPGDLVVAQLELAGALADAEERFARAPQPFDHWLRERVRVLHGVELRDGVAALGGRLHLDNRPAGGARVVAELPVPDALPPDQAT